MINVLFSFVGILFWFVTLTGRKLAVSGNIIWTTSYTLGTLFLSLVLGVLTGELLRRFFACFPSVSQQKNFKKKINCTKQ